MASDPDSFWSQHCPARPADLKHAHDRDCPDGHVAGQCCECGRHSKDWDPARVVKSIVSTPGPTTQPADHKYVYSMTGRCPLPGCGRPEADHPIMLRQKDPMTECTVDHNSIKSVHLIGDGGLTWTRCPFCHVMVEPMMARGEVTGSKYDPGRGDMTERLKRRLLGWRGWVDFLGGGR